MSAEEDTFDQMVRDRLRAATEQAVDEKIAELLNDPDAIRNGMVAMLLQEQRAVLAKVMGMEWQGDKLRPAYAHREDNSLRENPKLREIVDEAITEFGEAHKTELKKAIAADFKKSKRSMIEEITSSARYKLRATIANYMRDKVEKRAKRVISQVFGDLR